MKIDFSRARLEAAMDIGVNAAKAAVEADPNAKITEESVGNFPAVLQFQYHLHKNAELRQIVHNVLVTMTFAPESTVGILLAAGYEMGRQDALTANAVNDLEKLFALPSPVPTTKEPSK